MHTRRDQLLGLVDEETFLHEAQVEWNLVDTVQIFVEHEQFEILGAREVQVKPFAVADAGDLAASLTETFWF